VNQEGGEKKSGRKRKRRKTFEVRGKVKRELQEGPYHGNEAQDQKSGDPERRCPNIGAIK